MPTVHTLQPANRDLESQRILRRDEVLRLIGLKKSALYQLMAQGHFPRPMKLGERAVGWRATDVATWLSSRETA
ncbi:MAG: AlpA family phage regulatory protein [Tabrizicola sp.]|uniref:helix-turn-helix transcriptional regulator n=1 Tax=Tabrizicola sp. TaxID=2005166 RepID=UPI0027327E34|nr:AlpA family phage regulatory protein [Tabrizicola sp.]MDP3264220.1 AlpA family phage regulatory protein [Tabrizicola sp.]MDZ4067408.1 AlpA family phage regulatory protein [Tabrizicola sp.]